jgi:hypothetical protein
MEGGGDLLPSVRSVFDRSSRVGPAAGYVHICVNNPSVSGGLRQETADKRGQRCEMVWISVRKCEMVWISVEHLS